MSTPSTRSQLKDYCLRKLGFPVIDINVDEDQIDDRIDDALQTYSEFHYDATHADYLAIKLTPDLLANGSNTGSFASGGTGSNASIGNTTFGWVPLPDNVIGVNKIFPFTGEVVHGGGSSANFNIFDLNYQLRLNELYEFTSSSYQYYWIARTHIRTLELLLIGQNPVRFNKHMDRLYIDMNWQSEVAANSYVLVECNRVLDPVEFPKIMNDKWLKDYATQLIKRQWASNVSKYANYTLPGGMIINGDKLGTEADAEILKLESELRDTWEIPPTMLLG